MEMEWKEEQKQKARAKAVAALEGASASDTRVRCTADARGHRTPSRVARAPRNAGASASGLHPLRRGAARRGAADGAEDADADKDLPFACLICRQPFVDPVQTKYSSPPALPAPPVPHRHG
jgi:hypothetical protein